METQVSSVATLNDKFRRHGFDIVFTRGVRALHADEAVLVALRGYDDFTADNDPYGEHDFGSFELCGKKLFWKMDYYNQGLTEFCDPTDPKCRRFITVMLAEEY